MALAGRARLLPSRGQKARQEPRPPDLRLRRLVPPAGPAMIPGKPRAARNGLLISAQERMSHDKVRQAIAFEAARLMYERVESEYFTAKRKAAKRLCRRSCKPEDLPSNAEIRELIQTFARLHEGERRTVHLRAMRLEALKLMRLLRQFKPRLIGSVMTGHVRQGSDIDIHVFSDSAGLITGVLE